MPVLESAPDATGELVEELSRRSGLGSHAASLLAAKARLQVEFGGLIVAYRFETDDADSLRIDVIAHGATHAEVESYLSADIDRESLVIDYIEELDEDQSEVPALDAA